MRWGARSRSRKRSRRLLLTKQAPAFPLLSRMQMWESLVQSQSSWHSASGMTFTSANCSRAGELSPEKRVRCTEVLVEQKIGTMTPTVCSRTPPTEKGKVNLCTQEPPGPSQNRTIVGPTHRTRDATHSQIQKFSLWCCLHAVWTPPFTSTGPISLHCVAHRIPRPVWIWLYIPAGIPSVDGVWVCVFRISLVVSIPCVGTGAQKKILLNKNGAWALLSVRPHPPISQKDSSNFWSLSDAKAMGSMTPSWNSITPSTRSTATSFWMPRPCP